MVKVNACERNARRRDRVGGSCASDTQDAQWREEAGGVMAAGTEVDSESSGFGFPSGSPEDDGATHDRPRGQGEKQMTDTK